MSEYKAYKIKIIRDGMVLDHCEQMATNAYEALEIAHSSGFVQIPEGEPSHACVINENGLAISMEVMAGYGY